MPTTKARLNISLPPEVKKALHRLAERDRIPEATKAARLLELALEFEEDQVWNEIAEKRDKKGAKFISHARAWRQ